MVSCSQINELLLSTKLRLIGPSGRTITTCRTARAQGSIIKVQLKRNNVTDEKRFRCYANGRRAQIQGGTTPGALYARPSGYSRLSEEASALLAACGSKQQGRRIQRHAITLVASIDPESLESLIDMGMIDADSVDDCTDESVMEYLKSIRARCI
jgi:hypothetical protein